MRTKKQKKKELSDEQLEIVEAKDFFDCTMPGVIRFYTDHYICGNFYKSCWAVTEYPPSTEETAILARPHREYFSSSRLCAEAFRHHHCQVGISSAARPLYQLCHLSQGLWLPHCSQP